MARRPLDAPAARHRPCGQARVRRARSRAHPGRARGALTVPDADTHRPRWHGSRWAGWTTRWPPPSGGRSRPPTRVPGRTPWARSSSTSCRWGSASS
ncbi:hypothetical protein CBR64_08910 [Cellulosimicrobium cellulans]|uniref:Uncharacterized protein n=1 Tax=Cellulosimicrobium cellulans TaxID=1710 RepID=A0A1Y0HWQ4_CELCE|nr:hypothetical protein CBR64_08910 [Cellulosimicrobium cellulans]